MRIAAAGDAAKWHHRRRPVPGAEYLIRQFGAAVADLQANPDSPIHSDLRNFARAALARDEEYCEAGLDLETGPASWVSVWLQAEEMIRAGCGPL